LLFLYNLLSKNLKMFIINKSEAVQRTTVNWNKRDVKPWEIVEVTKDEWLYVTKSYADIFWVSEEAKQRKEAPKKKKKIKEED